jgi:hypothetical protein
MNTDYLPAAQGPRVLLRIPLGKKALWVRGIISTGSPSTARMAATISVRLLPVEDGGAIYWYNDR